MSYEQAETSATLSDCSATTNARALIRLYWSVLSGYVTGHVIIGNA